jgi:hypothetical protein
MLCCDGGGTWSGKLRPVRTGKGPTRSTVLPGDVTQASHQFLLDDAMHRERTKELRVRAHLYPQHSHLIYR